MSDEIEYLPSPKPLNGSQFSQGTLFNMKPSAEHRWPAGYTPERKAEVAGALTNVSNRHHDIIEPGTDEVYMTSSKYFTPDPALDKGRGKWARPSSEIHAAMDQQATNALTDTLARSTVPMEDLQSLPSISVENIPGQGGSYARPGTAWLDPNDPNAQERGRIMLGARGKRSWQEQTVIHELGHHVDYTQDPETFEEGRPNPDPALEGAAEGYAARHYVPRRNDPNPTYAANAAYTNMHGEPEFDRRFEEVSGKTPAEAMASPKAEDIPHRNMNFQQFLFSRSAPSDVTQAEGYKDYGQHRLYMDHAYERGSGSPELDTIKVGRGLAVHGLQKDDWRGQQPPDYKEEK